MVERSSPKSETAREKVTVNAENVGDRMGVTPRDREFAAQILEDFSTFEEGIENQEKLAQWLRNVRRAATSQPDGGAQASLPPLIDRAQLVALLQDLASVNLSREAVERQARRMADDLIARGLAPIRSTAKTVDAQKADASLEDAGRRIWESQQRRLRDQTCNAAKRPWRSKDVPDFFWDGFVLDARAAMDCNSADTTHSMLATRREGGGDAK